MEGWGGGGCSLARFYDVLINDSYLKAGVNLKPVFPPLNLGLM